MRILSILFFFIIFQSCSFDNKSGIWESETNISNQKNDDFSQFKDLVSENSPFKKELKIKDSFKFNLPELYQNSEWTDIFYNQYNA